MGAFTLLAFIAGVAIAMQAAMNAKLGVLLRSSMLGTGVAFLFACGFILVGILVSIRDYPALNDIKAVPGYLWFSGGALSAFGVAMFYYLIPRMGVGPMMTYALTGQLLMATLASHYGWFGLPESPITVSKVAGVVALTLGMFLINMGGAGYEPE